MGNLQVLMFLAIVLLSNGASINAFFRLHPNFPGHDDAGIFNGDGDKDTIVRAEKWSKYHGSKVDRFHAMRGIEWCQPLKRGAKRMMECQDRGRFPVKNECRGFLMCFRKGDKPIPSCCPYGLYFDHIQRTCIGKTDAQCFNVCQEPTAKYPDPQDPRKYLQCSNLGIPESVSCPKPILEKDGQLGDTLIFDSKTKQCKTQETINTEIDNLLGKEFDNAFQKTFGMPSFQVFNEDDFSQKAPSSSTPKSPPTVNPTQTLSSSSTPIPSPFVGFGPDPAKYKQLLDMAGDDSSDSLSVEDIDNDKPTFILT